MINMYVYVYMYVYIYIQFTYACVDYTHIICKSDGMGWDGMDW